jgi:hypothetical protein
MIGVGLSLPVIAGRAGDPLPGLSLGGALFDPARDERFYQTTSGILLSGAADPVGLMLDDQFGGALGPEKVSNGTFDSNVVGWQANGGATVVWDAGRAKVNVTGVSGGIRKNQTFALTVGKTYRVTAQFEDDTFNGDVALLVNSVAIQTLAVATGKIFATFVAASADPSFLIARTGSSTGAYFIDNISIREILGAHASQATTDNRPTRVLTGDVWGLEFDGTSDRLEGDAAMRDIFRNCDAGFFACVVEHVALGGKYIASWSTNGSTANQRFGLKASATGELIAEVRRADADTTASTTSAAGVITTSKQLVMAVLNYAAGTVDLYVSNPVTPAQSGSMPAGSGASANTASDAMRLGCKSDGSEFLSGRLHGPIVMGRIAPSAAQRQAIFSRLSSITGAPLS